MNFPGWLLLLYLAKGGDLTSTEYALNRGAVEMNPLMQHQWARVSTSVVAPAMIYWGTEELKKRGHPRWAMVLRIGTIALWGYATIHNLQQVR